MDFIGNQQPQIDEMLQDIGISSVEELFQDIPDRLRLPKPERDDGLSEYEGMRHMEELANKNSFQYLDNYLGAGAYEHHVPAIVNAICSRSEFLTAYTPYQAEASQGMLQSIFEFQSAICALTGLDIANASLYDAASACAEALLMALRVNKKRRKILIADSLHPHYRKVIEQYLANLDISLDTLPLQEDGQIGDLSAIDEETAAVIVQYPSFLGIIDDIKTISQKAKSVGALTIISANPLAYGLLANAKELGADIAVGDLQPLGLPLQFGGPYVGYMACTHALMRQIPGRIVGETVDTKGRRGFVLALQAREQHIRREKATSNICTNQALAALASLIAILWYGKQGIRKLALTNYQRAAYLKEQLEALPALTTFTTAPIFNEFVITFPGSIQEIQQRFRDAGIEPGLALGRYFPKWQNSLLIAVTETKSKKQLDHYIKVAKELV